jgi:hypothetical protein
MVEVVAGDQVQKYHILPVVAQLVEVVEVA